MASAMCLTIPAGVDGHLGRGVPGDRVGDLLERVEAARHPQQHHACAGEEFGAEGQRTVGVAQAELVGIGGEGEFAGERILVRPDACGSRRRRAQR